jgi:hypothetical protein
MKYTKLTKAQIKAMTSITEKDIEDAKESWKESAPTRFRGLLDAPKPGKV